MERERKKHFVSIFSFHFLYCHSTPSTSVQDVQRAIQIICDTLGWRVDNMSQIPFFYFFPLFLRLFEVKSFV
jgi:hypothetical protein